MTDRNGAQIKVGRGVKLTSGLYVTVREFRGRFIVGYDARMSYHSFLADDCEAA
jgi:hypothetical protein